jgi:hypothetical protein
VASSITQVFSSTARSVSSKFAEVSIVFDLDIRFYSLGVNRNMLRKLTASLCIMLAFGLVAEAAIIGTATQQSGAPGGVAFTSFEGTAGPPNLNSIVEGDGDSAWVSYVLRLTTNAGETISSINPTINHLGPTGGLHQRWGYDADAEAYNQASPSTNAVSGTNLTNGDTKLVVQGSLVLGPPTENRIAKANDAATTTPGFNTPHMGVTAETRNWGIGTTLTGNWGFTPGEQAAQAGNIPFAYLVIPRGSTPTIDINVVFTANDAQGQPIGTSAIVFTESDFGFGGPVGNTPPVVGLEAPQVQNTNGQVITTDFDAVDAETPGGPFDWAFTLGSFVPDLVGGVNNSASPTINDANGVFSWNTLGAARGVYTWNITATDGGPGDALTSAPSPFVVTITAVPEPGSIALFGIAMVGGLGLFRRRNG